MSGTTRRKEGGKEGKKSSGHGNFVDWVGGWIYSNGLL